MVDSGLENDILVRHFIEFPKRKRCEEPLALVSVDAECIVSHVCCFISDDTAS